MKKVTVFEPALPGFGLTGWNGRNHPIPHLHGKEKKHEAALENERPSDKTLKTVFICAELATRYATNGKRSCSKVFKVHASKTTRRISIFPSRPLATICKGRL